MVVITGGKLKGIRLKVPKCRGVRPTTNRVRESIFNILSSRIENTSILDIFAGSGILGIEALSRGAQKAVFVENNRRCCKTIVDNLLKCKLKEQALVICRHFMNATKELIRKNATFDLVFADPPYSVSFKDEIFTCVRSLVKEGSLLVLEQPGGIKKIEFDEKEWSLVREKRFGTTSIWLLERKV